MPPHTTADYHVGIICALATELAAVQAMLDEEYEDPEAIGAQDHNTYSFGRMHNHNIVIACLPAGRDGLAAAAMVAKDIMRTFDQLRYGLLVGIGGGIPDIQAGVDIRLGDVVVSCPNGTSPGVVQYDKGKDNVHNGWERKGISNAPPSALLTAMQQLKAKHRRSASLIPQYLKAMWQQNPEMRASGYAFPGWTKDSLYEGTYAHVTNSSNCENCDASFCVPRPIRYSEDPKIFYGTIASGNQVIKNAETRDKLREDCGAICVEMEAAGLMNDFPCLIIRGVCDYADSHKNDHWQDYAAATAAAYAKELLLYVSAEQTRESRTARDLLGVLSTQLQESRAQHIRQQAFLDRQEASIQNEDERKCHLSFKTTAYEHYKNINQTRAPDTCQWVLAHAQYQQWRQSDTDDLLWISADPGCGKSVLSKSLVDGDLHDNGSLLDSNVCYFFFKDNDTQDTLASALCALIHQLFAQQPQLIKHAVSAWRENGERIRQEADVLWRILRASTADESAGSVIVILDGLDECRSTDQGWLIGKLCEFYTESRSCIRSRSLKFLVTSRPYIAIEDKFRLLTNKFPTIRLRGEDHNETLRNEIDAVACSQVRAVADDLGLSPQLMNRIQEKLLGMHNRTYLWLQLVIEEVRGRFRNCLRPDHETVETLPVSVEVAYEQLLGRIDKGVHHIVRKIFLIIISARRPLTVGEMALALDIATASQSPKSISDLCIRPEHLERNIRHWCGLFVFWSGGELYLIHQTAKEFLVRSEQQSISVASNWKHCLGQSDCVLQMAQIYMKYLCLQEFNQDQLEDSAKTYPNELSAPVTPARLFKPESSRAHSCPETNHTSTFFQLAAESWADDWRMVEERAQDTMVHELEMLYDLSSKRVKRWLKLRRGYAYDIFSNTTQLHLAASLGHLVMAEKILHSDGDLLECRNKDDETPLITAARNGHVEMVQKLVEFGANVNAANPEFGTALHVACANKRQCIAEILVKNGANVNARTELNKTPLHIACGHDDSGMVQFLLLQPKIEPDPVNSFGRTPLLYAAIHDSTNVVELLLASHQIDVNRSDQTGQTALSEAACHSTSEILRLMLTRPDVLVNPVDRYGDTPLLAAIKDSKATNAEILLAQPEIEVNIQDRSGESPLSCAAQRGMTKLVDLLLCRADVKVDLRNVLGRTALPEIFQCGSINTMRLLIARDDFDVNDKHAVGDAAFLEAIKSGSTMAVKFLLDEAMVDLNLETTDGRTPLTLAINLGHLSTVEALLEHPDVHVNQVDSQGHTPLTLAASQNLTDLLTLLLSQPDIDVNQINGKGWTALATAVTNRSFEVAKLLLNCPETEVNMECEEGLNPLAIAVKRVDPEMFSCLISHPDVDVNRKCMDDVTPLMVAASFGHYEMATLLLSCPNTNINLCDAQNVSPLAMAASEGHARFVHLLLDQENIDVNLADEDGRTALILATINGDVEIARMLLESPSINVNHVANDGHNALSRAMLFGYEEIVDLLRANGGEVDDFMLALAYEFVE